MAHRIFLPGLFFAAALAASTAQAQSVAFTFDDGPHLSQTPLMSPQERNQAMLNALAKYQAKAALLVTTGTGAVRPEGYALAKAWGDAGHLIGNHTFSHPDLDNPKVTLEQYKKEILDCDAVIRTLPGYRKWFRFPYLHEGNTAEKREGIRAFLQAQGYRDAYVSLDTSDWRLAGELMTVLAQNPKADIQPFKRVYLAHVWQRAQAYHELSKKLLGRDAPLVILLHHNLLNALWLEDVLAQFKAKGWKFVTPDAAYADPLYQKAGGPEAGQNLLFAMAGRLGNFPGRERLADNGEFEIAELKRLGL